MTISRTQTNLIVVEYKISQIKIFSLKGALAKIIIFKKVFELLYLM